LSAETATPEFLQDKMFTSATARDNIVMKYHHRVLLLVADWSVRKIIPTNFSKISTFQHELDVPSNDNLSHTG